MTAADSNVTFATPINIPLERSLYIGIFFRGILYGLEIVTFFAAVYCISHRPPDYRKRQNFYIVYGGILLALTGIQVALDAVWGQNMWIDHRNYPGGPLGFFLASQAAWYNVCRFFANATTNMLGDGLLVYRCFIIWNSRWRIIALPALIYLASSVLSIISCVESAMPGGDILNGKPARFMVPWISLSVGLNIIVTLMICFRLLRMRALMREVLSPEMSSMYTDIAAMLVESAAPFSILGIGVVVTAAQKGPLMFAFGDVWFMFCVEFNFSLLTLSLCPQMIILRVAMGRGFLKETMNEISTGLIFAEPPTTHKQSQGICITIFNLEGTVSGPGTPVNRSETSVEKHMSVTSVIPSRVPIV